MSRYRDRRGRFAHPSHPDVRDQVIAEGIVGLLAIVVFFAFLIYATIQCGGPGMPLCK